MFRIAEANDQLPLVAGLVTVSRGELPSEDSFACLVPKKYANSATSGLTFEVSPTGKNYFEIDLKD